MRGGVVTFSPAAKAACLRRIAKSPPSGGFSPRGCSFCSGSLSRQPRNLKLVPVEVEVGSRVMRTRLSLGATASGEAGGRETGHAGNWG